MLKILRPWLSWIERQTTNLNVASSNLAGRTNKNKGIVYYGCPLVSFKKTQLDFLNNLLDNPHTG
jgi:hypothetical protein